MRGAAARAPHLESLSEDGENPASRRRSWRVETFLEDSTMSACRSVLLVTLFDVVLALPTAFAQPIPGYEIVQITFDPSFWETRSDLNNCGELAFSQRMGPSPSQSEIFLYDNGATKRVTSNPDRDVFPHLNNEGKLTWLRGLGVAGIHQVVVYEAGEESILFDAGVADGLFSGLSLNDLGHIVFTEAANTGCSGSDTRLWLYNGFDTTELIGPPGSHQSVDLNDFNGAVWTRYDWCVNPWDSDILLWVAGRTRLLTTLEDFEVQIPRINNSWQVVWGGPGGIRMWNGAAGVPTSVHRPVRPTTITDNGLNPSLNNRGDISFNRFHDDTDTGQLWLYHDGEIVQLTDDPVWSSNDSRINDWGEIVWKTSPGFPISDLVFMRRIRTGEADFDGDIDLDDATVLHDCLTGPGDFDRLCDCRFLDIDHDRDVDLADFAAFQRAYGGN